MENEKKECFKLNKLYFSYTYYKLCINYRHGFGTKDKCSDKTKNISTDNKSFLKDFYLDYLKKNYNLRTKKLYIFF